jgi:hypothetical protein
VSISIFQGEAARKLRTFLHLLAGPTNSIHDLFKAQTNYLRACGVQAGARLEPPRCRHRTGVVPPRTNSRTRSQTASVIAAIRVRRVRRSASPRPRSPHAATRLLLSPTSDGRTISVGQLLHGARRVGRTYGIEVSFLPYLVDPPPRMPLLTYTQLATADGFLV